VWGAAEALGFESFVNESTSGGSDRGVVEPQRSAKFVATTGYVCCFARSSARYASSGMITLISAFLCFGSSSPKFWSLSPSASSRLP
jgi:hypothetical protein